MSEYPEFQQDDADETSAFEDNADNTRLEENNIPIDSEASDDSLQSKGEYSSLGEKMLPVSYQSALVLRRRVLAASFLLCFPVCLAAIWSTNTILGSSGKALPVSWLGPI